MTILSTKLIRWYRTHKRDLPWRRRPTADPYRILVSEFMLQQTQVQTVIPYYTRWLKRFPTFGALANAPLNGVLKTWEGLGYYARARNLHTLAKIVMKKHRGRLPNDVDALQSLPGIGRYTAGAVMSIAFGRRYPVLDGNVQRVLARHFAIRKDLSDAGARRELWALAGSLVPRVKPGDFNQALMELGATICTPKNPDCGRCPLRTTCRALRMGLQSALPVTRKAKPTPHYDIGAGVIWKNGLILISQRPLNGLLGGLWEFPGGKREAGESLAETVRREIREELGVRVQVGSKIAEVDHAYSHFKITLHAHACRYVSGQPQALGCRAWRWVRPAELDRLAFPAANQPIITQIRKSGPIPSALP